MATATAVVLQRSCVTARRRIEVTMPCALPYAGVGVSSGAGRPRESSGTVRGARFSPAAGSRRAAARSGSAVVSATLPTRLETRTKESNVSASRRVVRDSQAK